MGFMSAEYFDLVRFYCGDPAKAVLPPELCLLCLEIAGLCGRGPRRTFFWIYC